MSGKAHNIVTGIVIVEGQELFQQLKFNNFMFYLDTEENKNDIFVFKRERSHKILIRITFLGILRDK